MLTLLLAATVASVSPFEAASQAYRDLDVAAAKRLFADAASHDSDSQQRARAALRLANIEWHIERDAGAARKSLDLVTDEESLPAAWIERARIDEELSGDFDAARQEAQHAVDAPKITDRQRAAVAHAAASIEPAMRGRTVDAALLESAKKELHDSIDRDGSELDTARWWLDAAIVTNDGAAALAAWRAYFGETAKSSILAPAETALGAWSDRRGAGLALARSGLIREAAFVLRALPDTPRDADVFSLLAYADYVAKVRVIADDYYRDIALHRADAKAFRAAIEAQGESLWNALAWNGKPPHYSVANLEREIGRRFNAVVAFGNTANLLVLHYAHKVLDERRTVSQFGRSAPLEFVLLDGIVSNGFLMWYTTTSGDGGWATAEAIYQVRPMYANGPLRMWQQVTDPVMRTERDRNVADETARDAGRASAEPVRFFPGVQLRLAVQYEALLMDELQPAGLAGDALRAAFIARVELDTFESSIWSHEGRHAIDKKYELWLGSPELEYRAKLSQLEFAPSARHALIDIGGVGNVEFGDTPHGKGNRRVTQALAGWMRSHPDQVKELDPSKPLMLQLDKLSDDQIRAAARAVDPLAKQ